MRVRDRRLMPSPRRRGRSLVRVTVSIGLVASVIVATAVPASATPGWVVAPSAQPSGPPQGALNSVVCPNTTSCFAVGNTTGDGPVVEHWNRTGWSVMSAPNPASGADLNSVACPSTTTCFAVGSGGGSTLVERWDGKSWSIVASPSPSGATRSLLEGVACSSTASCFAVGTVETADSDQTTLVERWDGTDWSIIDSPNPTGSTRSYLLGVSCPTTTNCFAVGGAESNSILTTLVEQWDGTNWSIVASPNPSGASQSQLNSVSCRKATSCTAVGLGGNLTLVEQWAGSSWSIVASANPSGAVSADLSDVTCVTARDCVAVGQYYDGSNNNAFVEHWDGTNWSLVASPNPPGANERGLGGVSCLSATNCFAVGGAAYTMIEHWDGTTWSIVAAPSGSSESQFAQVACSKINSCFAVGNYATATVRKTLTERWNGAKWSRVPSPNPTGAIQSYLRGVSCQSVTSCFAVGDSVTSSSPASVSLIEQWNGTRWSIVANPNPAFATADILTGVACASTTSCFAVGSYGLSSNFAPAQTMIEQWDGTTWSLVASPSPSDGTLEGVTCPSTTSCFAVGTDRGQTLAYQWNGTSWSRLVTPSPDGARLHGVACSNPTSCFAVGDYIDNAVTGRTLVEHWNGAVWSIVPSADRSGAPFDASSLLSVACPGATNCYAVGLDYSSSTNYNDETLVEHWDGTSWTIVTSGQPTVATAAELSGVVCPTTTKCYAAGDFSTAISDNTLVERTGSKSATSG